ncbi:MAG: hypothetical protein EBZ77_15200, partial [Chitinophagia bacterium]|nr:hypothetical protein [Chitinophagia bacterium]
DVNGDGRVEIIVAAAGFASVDVFKNASTPGTITMRNYVDCRMANQPLNAVAADLDGDMYPDIVSVNSAAASISIVRNYPLPKIDTIRGDTSVCFNGDTAHYSNLVAGGTWRLWDSSRASLDDSVIVTGIHQGLDSIFYRVIWGGDTSEVGKRVNVDTFQTVTRITGSRSACIGGNDTLRNTIAAGRWVSSRPSVATVDSVTGIARGVAAGTTVITYMFANACSSSSDTFEIRVYPTPVIGPLTGPNTVCTGYSLVLTDTPTTNGTVTWSSSAPSIASVSTTGRVNGLSAGTAIITFTFSNFCGSRSDTQNVRVNTAPSLSPATGLAVMCAGDTTRLSNSTSGGRWYGDDNTVATIDSMTGFVRALSAGTVVFTYSLTNSCGTALDTLQMTVNPQPVSGTISGPNTACGAGHTFTLTTTGAGGAWVTSNASIASVDASGIVYSVSVGRAIISYSVINSCNTATDTLMFEVQAAPDAGVLSGVS